MGGLESISVEAFNEDLAYTALGHIHKAQRVGGREHVRYAGSPLPMSFSEQHYHHQVVAFTLKNGCLSDLEAVPIPLRTALHRIPAEPALPAEVLLQLSDLPLAEEGPQPMALSGSTGAADGARPGFPASGRGGAGG